MAIPFTILSANSQAFINNLNNGNMSRSKSTLIAIGKVIASNIPLPTEKVVDPISFYETNFKSITADYVNDLLILVPTLDFNTLTNYVLKFWLIRYDVMYPVSIITINSKDNVVEDFLSITNRLDQDTICSMVESVTNLQLVHNSYAFLLKEVEEFTNKITPNN